VILDQRALADRGYWMLPYSAAGWPNFAPDLIDLLAIQACVEEQETGCSGGTMPTEAPGACRTCQHHQIVHSICRWACEVRGCDCRKAVPVKGVRLAVTLNPDGTLVVRDRADIQRAAGMRVAA
jgi:hypothetical protein